MVDEGLLGLGKKEVAEDWSGQVLLERRQEHQSQGQAVQTRGLVKKPKAAAALLYQGLLMLQKIGTHQNRAMD